MAKWYNLFISVDPSASGDASPSPSTESNAAQAIADIAKSVNIQPEPFVSKIEKGMVAAGSPSGPASFSEVYQAAEILPPANGYTIFKVAEMLQSEHIRSLPVEIKRSSVLVALEAAGVKIAEVIQDAVKRDKALDTFEMVQQKALDALDLRMAAENKKLQEEADRVLNELRAKMQANNDAVTKEREKFLTWRLEKQKEEQRIADAVAPFTSPNPVSTGPVAAPAPPAPAPGPKQ